MLLIFSYILVSALIFITVTFLLFKSINPDISKFFKNEMLKIFTFDMHWLLKNKSLLRKKNLFIVMGANSNSYFNELNNIHNPENESLIYFEDAKKPFEITHLKSTYFLFINHNLFELNESTGRINLNRILRNINSILKMRRHHHLDGIIIFPNQIAFEKNISNLKDLSEEAKIYSKVFKQICLKLKSKIPLFFIENSQYNEIPPFQSVSSIDSDNEVPFFGFSHHTLKNTDDLNKEIKNAIDDCIYSFEQQCQYYLQQFNDKAQIQVQVLRFFYNLKSGLVLFSKNYIDYFYKSFQFKDKNLTNLHYILNISSFHENLNQSDKNSYLLNTFNHISTVLINGSEISNEFIRNKNRKRLILSIFTILNLIFVTYAIFSSQKILRQKRDIFLKSFSELNLYISNYKQVTNNLTHSSILQSKICSLINNSNTLQSTSFYSTLLFPTWYTHLDLELTDKYNSSLANFTSTILIQHLNEKISKNLDLQYLAGNDALESPDLIKKINKFVDENNSINQIYGLINDPNPVKNTEAFPLMTHLLYGVDCGKSLVQKNIFSTLNMKNIRGQFNFSFADFKTKSNEVLKQIIQIYIQSNTKNNEILIAINNLVSNLNSITKLDNSDLQNQDIALSKKILMDINSLQDSLLKSQDNLKNMHQFYGTEFKKLLTEIEKNASFGIDTSNSISTMANEQFEQFKLQLSTTSSFGTTFPLLINNAGTFNLNPALQQIALALTKMSSVFEDNAVNLPHLTNNKPFSSDLHSIDENLPENALWDIDSLQSNLQSSISFTGAVNSVNQLQIPEILSIYFNRLANSLSSIFWKKNLPNSLKIFNINNQSLELANLQIDPSIQNIQMSTPILKSISDQLLQFKQNEINSSLSSIVNQQIDRQIKKYSDSLNSSLFFTAIDSDFLWWNGEVSPAFHAFGVNSEENLKLYINNQKIALEQFFNKNIQPLLQARNLYFKNPTNYSSDRALSNLLVVNDALSATPKTNSFALLSNFITMSMFPLRSESCQKFISQPPALSHNDFFAIKLNSIYSPLENRCQSLLIKQAFANYDKFAFQFNSSLAGKYPFQSKDYATGSASLDDMNEIFNQFSQLQKQDIAILKKFSALYRGRSDVQNFVDNMTKLQNFFNPQNDKEGNPIPTKWNVEFYFRTNTDKEILGNQLINWSLQTGSEVIGSVQGNNLKGKFIWSYSDPIQFSVSLAQGSKYTLEKISDDKNIFISNNTVYFGIKNRWSLLKFIDDYADCGNSKFCLRNNLKFELPINNEKSITFYVSLYLKNSKGIRVNVPSFPTSAPYIEKKNIKQITTDNYE
ncbi:hypothetical protein [Silvanigrella aquatica]|uniref:IcmF-related N-terminal domain-containing protein n=1 Tax=Silvanigrella aquatica TaxID=1915309 RepID=A0A1L4CZ26_9BACT|nr:hypothetical protein [Silvanigrella aquatica]APJ03198.1 hypothetical protein AXG55_04485 [Silvanigrella aquatica]